MRNVVLLALSAVFLAGCAQQPKMVWLRVDGQRMAGNPVLATQFEVDSTACLGQRNAAALSGVTVANGGLAGVVAAVERDQAANTVQRGCMAEKGYLHVAEEQAEQRASELASINAQRQRQAMVPAPTPTPRRR